MPALGLGNTIDAPTRVDLVGVPVVGIGSPVGVPIHSIGGLVGGSLTKRHTTLATAESENVLPPISKSDRTGASSSGAAENANKWVGGRGHVLKSMKKKNCRNQLLGGGCCYHDGATCARPLGVRPPSKQSFDDHGPTPFVEKLSSPLEQAAVGELLGERAHLQVNLYRTMLRRRLRMQMDSPEGLLALLDVGLRMHSSTMRSPACARESPPSDTLSSATP